MTDAVSQAQPSPSALKGAKVLGWLTRRAYPLLAILCVALWLPGILTLPALDRDESRFAQSSRQMLDSGNFVDIRFGNEPRYKKPAGIYWAQAAATAVAGHVENIEGDHSHIWTYRLPSLIGGIVATWLTFWIGSAFGAGYSFMSACILGSIRLAGIPLCFAAERKMDCSLGSLVTRFAPAIARGSRNMLNVCD